MFDEYIVFGIISMIIFACIYTMIAPIVYFFTSWDPKKIDHSDCATFNGFAIVIGAGVWVLIGIVVALTIIGYVAFHIHEVLV